MKLSNKTVVLTGATGGIGTEIARKLVQEGAKLILISKSDQELSKLKSLLKSEKVETYTCDLNHLGEVTELGNKLSTKFPVIDVLINSAGVGIYKALEDVSLEDWSRSMNINVNAPFLLIKTLLLSLKKSEDSVVINMGSGNGEMAIAGRSLYCTTKFALRGMSLSLAKEFRGTKPDFILLTLGSVLTGFGPMTLTEKQKDMESGKGYLTPEWVASNVIDIIKSEKREYEYKYYPSGYVPEN